MASLTPEHNWRGVDAVEAKYKHIARYHVPSSEWHRLTVVCLEKTLRDYRDSRLARRLLLAMEREQNEGTGLYW
jgi:hypothetical protein